MLSEFRKGFNYEAMSCKLASVLDSHLRLGGFSDLLSCPSLFNIVISIYIFFYFTEYQSKLASSPIRNTKWIYYWL